MSIKNIIHTIITLILFSCKTIHEKQNPLMYQGCIVDNYNPIWVVAKDTASNSAWSELNPMPIVDDKTIVGSYKNRCPGFRCLEIETGKIIWEWYADANIENSKFGAYLSCTKGQTYTITTDKKYLIFAWNPSLFDQLSMLHIAIDVATGKEVWRKNIPSQGNIHIGYDAYDDYYYCSAFNIYTPENSKYHNQNAYKVRISDGQIDEVFRPTTEVKIGAHCRAIPFSLKEKKYLLVTEKIFLDEEDEDNHTYKYGIIDRQTWDTLAWHDDADKHLPVQPSAIHVYNDIVYVMFGLGGYSILNLEKKQFTENYIWGKKSHNIVDGKKVQATADWYTCSYFYNNKIIIGMNFQTTQNLQSHSQDTQLPFHIALPRGLLIDASTNKMIKHVHTEHNPSIMDDILYYTENHNFYAFDINTGEKKIDLYICDYEASGTSSVYKNAKGEKFVIVSNVDYTYCFPGL